MPEHSGVKGEEKADELDSEGSNTVVYNSELFTQSFFSVSEGKIGQ